MPLRPAASHHGGSPAQLRHAPAADTLLAARQVETGRPLGEPVVGALRGIDVSGYDGANKRGAALAQRAWPSCLHLTSGGGASAGFAARRFGRSLSPVAPPAGVPARTSFAAPTSASARPQSPPSGGAWQAKSAALPSAAASQTVPAPPSVPVTFGTSFAGLDVPRVTAFRYVHHWHSIPGPHNLLLWDDPSRTGDHYAISRYATAFSLQFVHLARVIGQFPAHIALGVVAAMLFGIGVRQGIHSMLITNRILQGLKAEGKGLDALIKPHGHRTPVYLRALRRRNRHLQWVMRYGIVLDFSATVGSAGLGVGTLFRYPLLGELSPPLFHAAIPVLTHFFFPLVVPSAVAAVERASRSLLTFHKTSAVGRHLKTVQDGRAPHVNGLYKKRQHELARYFAMDAAARGGLVIGATLSVFVGPGGLLLLVPAILAVIASECLARRVLNVDDTFPLKERLRHRTDQDYFTSIMKADTDAKSVQALRLARHERYPWGWGTAFRPVIRMYREKFGDKKGDPRKSAQVLGAFDRRETKIGKGSVPDPVRVMDILDDARARALFAEAILRDKKICKELIGHGVSVKGRKWSVDADQVAMYMTELQYNPQRSQRPVDDLYQLAEETLLTRGRVELRRRLRALLDYYGRFARASLRAVRRQRRATHRSDS